MDIMMPKMDGYTACSELKLGADRSGIPIVFVSAHGFELNKELAMRLGADRYLVKPISLRMLLDTITKCLLPSNFKEVREECICDSQDII